MQIIEITSKITEFLLNIFLKLELFIKNRLTCVLVIIIVTILCRESPYEPWEINFEKGIVPDTIINFHFLNTEFDDLNIGVPPRIENSFNLLISSNRNQNGVEFDIFLYSIVLNFSKVDGNFMIEPFEPFKRCVEPINDSSSNEYGPYYVNINKWLTQDYNNISIANISESNRSWESWIIFLSSDRNSKDSTLDIWITEFEKLSNIANVNKKDIKVYNAKPFNTEYDDCYISFGPGNMAYFCSNRDGNYNIYYIKMKDSLNQTNIIEYFTDTLNKSDINELDIVNSIYDEKCPYVNDNKMVFISNRDSGYGGFDIYLSKYINDNWSEPINIGNRVNTEFDEYRPVLISITDFENQMLLFSSNRVGGKGGFDIYYIGIN